ncbi:MAG TPA: flagellar biosynthetic protein FliR [Lacipirellulaceae bacterium]|jgi:flagellar biosynthetic protein FliR|nr:flagellar biosynthetic protein FliR [Lacipirellulaceae bacterium]
MNLLETFLVSRFMVFTLVLARTSSLVMTAPIFGTLTMPRQVRVILAVAMSLLVAPAFLNTSLPPLNEMAEYGRLMVNEVLVGLLLGLSMNILFSGVQVAGQIVSQLSGMSLADVFNPGFDEDISVFAQLFYFLTVAVFVSVGGHRIVTQALMDTFSTLPPGHAVLGSSFVDVITSIITQAFVLGIHAAAPLATALLLSNLVLGLISRTLPQINVIAVGFGVNSLLTLGLMFLTIGAAAWVFQDPTIDVMQRVQESLVVGR